MKKLYTTPEMEIKKFNTEDIMNASANITPLAGEDAYNNADQRLTDAIDYSTLYTIE